jgi:hypothetical protein
MIATTGARTIAALTLVVTMGGCMMRGSGESGAGLVSVTYIAREPPPDRVELASVRPSEEHVWIAGHWAARANNYAWTKGRWVLPVSGKTEWQSGKWEHEEHGWHYTEGHWV